jgi:hypothetical protein
MCLIIMRNLHFSLWLVMYAVIFVPVVHGADAATIINKLPRSFSGEFQWRRSVRVYQVMINFNRIRELPAGHVEATGTGLYDEYGEVSRVNIRAVIYPENLYLEMFENEQRTSDLAGIYRGDLSEDLQSITAIWTNFLDKRRGTLSLIATP